MYSNNVQKINVLIVYLQLWAPQTQFHIKQKLADRWEVRKPVSRCEKHERGEQGRNMMAYWVKIISGVCYKVKYHYHYTVKKWLYDVVNKTKITGECLHI